MPGQKGWAEMNILTSLVRIFVDVFLLIPICYTIWIDI